MIPLNRLSKHQGLSELRQCLKNLLKEEICQFKEHFGVTLSRLSDNEKEDLIKAFSESIVDFVSQHVASESKNGHFYIFCNLAVFGEFGLASAALLRLDLLEGVFQAD